MQLGKQLTGATGRELSNEQAGRVGVVVHRSLGVTYGILAAALVGRGMRPLRAGLAVGAGAWVLVDEGTAVSTFTSYPVESHLRRAVGHGTVGLAIGLLLALAGEG